MQPSHTPTSITTERFEADVLGAELPTIIDFWAPWCGPCRAIGPVLDDVAKRYAGKVRVFKVNVDEEPAIAEAFQVRGIPMVVGMHGNAVVDVQVGFRGPAPLRALAERLGAMGAPAASPQDVAP